MTKLPRGTYTNEFRLEAVESDRREQGRPDRRTFPVIGVTDAATLWEAALV